MHESIESLIKRDVVTLASDASCEQAARAMREHSVGSLVVSEARRPVGIVTDRDLAVRVVAEGRDPAKTPVSEVMSGYPVFAARDRTVADVLSAMQNLTVRRMPIVDEDGLLIGLVSLDDVILFLAEKFGEVAATIRKEIGGV